jgi:hypothetical protein
LAGQFSTVSGFGVTRLGVFLQVAHEDTPTRVAAFESGVSLCPIFVIAFHYGLIVAFVG